MAVLTEFTKEMLLRSSYGDERAAVEIAKKCADFYFNKLGNKICRSRHESLVIIICEIQCSMEDRDE